MTNCKYSKKHKNNKTIIKFFNKKTSNNEISNVFDILFLRSSHVFILMALSNGKTVGWSTSCGWTHHLGFHFCATSLFSKKNKAHECFGEWALSVEDDLDAKKSSRRFEALWSFSSISANTKADSVEAPKLLPPRGEGDFFLEADFLSHLHVFVSCSLSLFSTCLVISHRLVYFCIEELISHQLGSNQLRR